MNILDEAKSNITESQIEDVMDSENSIEFDVGYYKGIFDFIKQMKETQVEYAVDDLVMNLGYYEAKYYCEEFTHKGKNICPSGDDESLIWIEDIPTKELEESTYKSLRILNDFVFSNLVISDKHKNIEGE